MLSFQKNNIDTDISVSNVNKTSINLTSLKNLSDAVLIEQFKNLILREKRLGDLILLNLQEMNSRKIYAQLGFGSLFEFLVKYFHLGESSAYQRINAMKLIQSVPEARAALVSGETNLSTMAATQGFIRKLESEKKETLSSAEKKDIFDAVKGKTQKEAQAAFVIINPIAALPANKEKPLTANHTFLQITVDQETLQLLQEVKSLLSHEIPDGDLSKILKKICKGSLEILKKKKGRSADNNFNITDDQLKTTDYNLKETEQQCLGTDHQTKHRSSKHCEIKKTSRYVPIETRRLIFQKAHGRCEFISSEGKRCESHYQLEIDHKVAWSQGGSHEESNLRCLCRVHNTFRTKETHGFWWRDL
jgi:hypothetical protein